MYRRANELFYKEMKMAELRIHDTNKPYHKSLTIKKDGKHVEVKLPEESGSLITNVDIKTHASNQTDTRKLFYIRKPDITKHPYIQSDFESGKAIIFDTYETSDLFVGLHTKTIVQIAINPTFTKIVHREEVDKDVFEYMIPTLGGYSGKIYIRYRFLSNETTSEWSDKYEITYTAVEIGAPEVVIVDNDTIMVNSTEDNVVETGTYVQGTELTQKNNYHILTPKGFRITKATVTGQVPATLKQTSVTYEVYSIDGEGNKTVLHAGEGHLSETSETTEIEYNKKFLPDISSNLYLKAVINTNVAGIKSKEVIVPIENIYAYFPKPNVVRFDIKQLEGGPSNNTVTKYYQTLISTVFEDYNGYVNRVVGLLGLNRTNHGIEVTSINIDIALTYNNGNSGYGMSTLVNENHATFTIEKKDFDKYFEEVLDGVNASIRLKKHDDFKNPISMIFKGVGPASSVTVMYRYNLRLNGVKYTSGMSSKAYVNIQHDRLQEYFDKYASPTTSTANNVFRLYPYGYTLWDAEAGKYIYYYSYVKYNQEGRPETIGIENRLIGFSYGNYGDWIHTNLTNDGFGTDKDYLDKEVARHKETLTNGSRSIIVSEAALGIDYDLTFTKMYLYSYVSGKENVILRMDNIDQINNIYKTKKYLTLNDVTDGRITSTGTLMQYMWLNNIDYDSFYYNTDSVEHIEFAPFGLYLEYVCNGIVCSKRNDFDLGTYVCMIKDYVKNNFNNFNVPVYYFNNPVSVMANELDSRIMKLCDDGVKRYNPEIMRKSLFSMLDVNKPISLIDNGNNSLYTVDEYFNQPERQSYDILKRITMSDTIFAPLVANIVKPRYFVDAISIVYEVKEGNDWVKVDKSEYDKKTVSFVDSDKVTNTWRMDSDTDVLNSNSSMYTGIDNYLLLPKNSIEHSGKRFLDYLGINLNRITNKTMGYTMYERWNNPIWVFLQYFKLACPQHANKSIRINVCCKVPFTNTTFTSKRVFEILQPEPLQITSRLTVDNEILGDKELDINKPLPITKEKDKVRKISLTRLGNILASNKNTENDLRFKVTQVLGYESAKEIVSTKEFTLAEFKANRGILDIDMLEERLLTRPSWRCTCEIIADGTTMLSKGEVVYELVTANKADTAISLPKIPRDKVIMGIGGGCRVRYSSISDGDGVNIHTTDYPRSIMNGFGEFDKGVDYMAYPDRISSNEYWKKYSKYGTTRVQSICFENPSDQYPESPKLSNGFRNSNAALNPGEVKVTAFKDYYKKIFNEDVSSDDLLVSLYLVSKSDANKIGTEKSPTAAYLYDTTSRKDDWKVKLEVRDNNGFENGKTYTYFAPKDISKVDLPIAASTVTKLQDGYVMYAVIQNTENGKMGGVIFEIDVRIADATSIGGLPVDPTLLINSKGADYTERLGFKFHKLPSAMGLVGKVPNETTAIQTKVEKRKHNMRLNSGNGYFTGGNPAISYLGCYIATRPRLQPAPDGTYPNHNQNIGYGIYGTVDPENFDITKDLNKPTDFRYFTSKAEIVDSGVYNRDKIDFRQKWIKMPEQKPNAINANDLVLDPYEVLTNALLTMTGFTIEKGVIRMMCFPSAKGIFKVADDRNVYTYMVMPLMGTLLEDNDWIKMILNHFENINLSPALMSPSGGIGHNQIEIVRDHETIKKIIYSPSMVSWNNFVISGINPSSGYIQGVYRGESIELDPAKRGKTFGIYLFKITSPLNRRKLLSEVMSPSTSRADRKEYLGVDIAKPGNFLWDDVSGTSYLGVANAGGSIVPVYKDLLEALGSTDYYNFKGKAGTNAPNDVPVWYHYYHRGRLIYIPCSYAWGYDVQRVPWLEDKFMYKRIRYGTREFRILPLSRSIFQETLGMTYDITEFYKEERDELSNQARIPGYGIAMNNRLDPVSGTDGTGGYITLFSTTPNSDRPIGLTGSMASGYAGYGGVMTQNAMYPGIPTQVPPIQDDYGRPIQNVYYRPVLALIADNLPNSPLTILN